MTYYLRTTFCAALLASGLLPAHADDDNRSDNWQQSFPLSILNNKNVAVGRPDLNRPLSYRDTEASKDQVDPLNKTASIVFGSQIGSIGDAAKMILRPVGYELLTSGPNVSPLLDELLESPLPDNQREFTHLRVREMLRALAGVGHVVVFDHVHRKATFDPRPRYSKLGQDSQRDTPLSILTNDASTVESMVVEPTPVSVAPITASILNTEEKAFVVEPVSLEWRKIDTKPSADSFSAQVAQVLAEEEPIDPVEVVESSASTATVNTVEVRSDSESRRLRLSTEKSLRRLAGDFNAANHSVVIKNCSGEVSPSSLNRHTSLIGSSLVRLGVEPQYQSTEPCDVDRSSTASQGEIVHVIALVNRPSEG